MRGAYGGCVCYFSFSGNMDSCITIRTFVIKDGKIYIQAGAGIVADSNPETEYQETVNKVKALVKSVELAEGRTLMTEGKKKMILMIDNYDSFTYNLVHYLGELGQQIEVKRNDCLDFGFVDDP